MRANILVIICQLKSVEIVGLKFIFEKYVASSEMEVICLGLCSESFSIIKQNHHVEVLSDSLLFTIYFMSRIIAKYTRKLCFPYLIIIAVLVV